MKYFLKFINQCLSKYKEVDHCFVTDVTINYLFRRRHVVKLYKLGFFKINKVQTLINVSKLAL